MNILLFFLYKVLPLLILSLLIFKKDHFEDKHNFWKNQKWKTIDICLILLLIIFFRLISLSFYTYQSFIFIYGRVVFNFMLGFLIYWVLSYKYELNFSAIGLSAQNLLLNITIGFLTFLLYGFLAVTIISLAGRDPLAIGTHYFIKMGLKDFPLTDLIVYIFGLLIIAPFVEECLFRGMMYGPLKRKIGVLGSICATSAIWATNHMLPKSFFSIFLIGIILCFLYRKTKSLIPSITMHFMINFSILAAYLHWAYFG